MVYTQQNIPQAKPNTYRNTTWAIKCFGSFISNRNAVVKKSVKNIGVNDFVTHIKTNSCRADEKNNTTTCAPNFQPLRK